MEKKSHFPAEFQLKSGRTLDRVGKNGFKAKMNFTESLGSKTPSLSPDLCSKSAFTDTEKAVSGTDESRRKSSGYISLQCKPLPCQSFQLCWEGLYLQTFAVKVSGAEWEGKAC